MPIIDAREFDTWACDILQGKLLWTTLQYHTPLYPYFLASVYKISGYNPWHVIIVNYFIASGAGVLVYLITKKLTNRMTALIAAFFVSTYWFLLYIQSFIFSENISLALNVALVYLLVKMPDRPKKYFISGIVFGLSVLCRPDILLFAFFIIFWFIFKKFSLKDSAKYYGLFLLALSLVLAPIVFRNYVISGDILLRTQIWTNLYLGNDPAFKGTVSYVEIGKQWDDFISLPYQEYKRVFSEAESNHFFINKTISIIRQRPLDWIKLTASKFFSVLTGRDFLRAEDVYFYRFYLAHTLWPIISTRLIFILAVPGIIISLKEYRRFVPLYLILASVAFILFFQITTRYFMPIMPFVIIFCAYCISRLYRSAKEKKWKEFLTIIFLIAACNTAAWYNPLNVTPPRISSVYYAIAKNYHTYGIPQKAIPYYKRTIQLDPKNLSAHNDLGLLFMKKGDYSQAIIYFKNALAIDPAAQKPLLNLRLCKELMQKK